MTKAEVMHQLEALGTAQNRKGYARHGVKGEMFGVSYAHQGKLSKKIKMDHALAQELWATGNHDARVLATMVADPMQVDARLLGSWAQDLDNYVLTDAFARLVARSPWARQQVDTWTETRDEWPGSAGWTVLTLLALEDTELPDAAFEPYLQAIERRLPSSANRIRHSMNGALIAIGTRSPALEQQALAVAQKLGKVQVDHGETGCKTPDAASYMRKTIAKKGYVTDGGS